MLIGISGKARAGKDLLASIASKDGWKRLAFADELKRRVRDDFGLTLGHTDGPLKEEPTHFFHKAEAENSTEFAAVGFTFWTPREMMIEYGQFYRQFDPLYWVKFTLNKLNGTNSDQNYIITDVRFPNEANAIKNSGGFLIRLERHPSRDNLVSESTKQNISETALDTYGEFDFVLSAENNHTPEDLLSFWNLIKTVIQSKV